MKELLPFLLAPCYKDYLWGGNRLGNEYGKDKRIIPLAESWECSTNEDGESYVASGAFINKSLKDVLKTHPSYIGTHPISQDGQIPVMVKLIDANKDLSIQVHPDDEYARLNEKGKQGKTEFWYILESQDNSSLIYGLKNKITKKELIASAKDGTIINHLQIINAKKNDVFFLEPGIIHAIGSGLVVAEVQENSNLTYRLFDYNRVDKDGKKRELHIKKASDVAVRKSSAQPRQPIRVLKYRPGFADELLSRCRYFEVHRLLINSKESNIYYKTLETSFRLLLCIEGSGLLKDSKGHKLFDFGKGSSIFVPANSEKVKIEGKMNFIEVIC